MQSNHPESQAARSVSRTILNRLAPRVDGTLAKARSMKTEQPHAATNLHFDQLDVVIVDDAKPMQTILRSMLHSFRVGRVRTFDNAQVALQAMLVDSPNLIITDWRKDHVDGIRLLHALRALRMGELAVVPAIIVTGTPTRRLVEASVRVSAHSVLAKPLAPATLQKRIDAILHDPRPFVLNPRTGEWMLKGTEQVLDEHRSRWQQLHTARSSFAETLTAGGQKPGAGAEPSPANNSDALTLRKSKVRVFVLPGRPGGKTGGLNSIRPTPVLPAPQPEQKAGQGDGKAA